MADRRADKDGHLKRRPFWARLARSWAVVLGVMTVLGTGLAVKAELDKNEALSAEELRLDDRRPQRLASDCLPYELDTGYRYDGLSIAHLKCDPLGRGPEIVKFHLFTNSFDLHRFMDILREEREDEGVDCSESGFPYASPWIDRRGRVGGEVLCADYLDTSKIMWSHENSLVVGSAAAAPEMGSDLQLWWQREVRFGGGAPPLSQRRRLLDLLPESFGICRPRPLLTPTALSGVLCEPGNGISTAGAELFSDRRLLSDYLRRRARVEGVDDEGCRESPFSFSSYGLPPTYEPVLGHLFCRPQGGEEWFEWTALDSEVYAYAARPDSNARKLYEQWSSSLSRIRLPPDQAG